MSTGGPDLFVICKSCGSEVSPYITECPYCGSRLRKRAPKLERGGAVAEPGTRRRPTVPALGPLRRGEIPGIRPDPRPYVSLGIVVVSLLASLLWRSGLVHLSDLIVVGPPGDAWWRVATAPFTYPNTGYAFAALTAIGVFGWLVERRHGPAAVAVLFILGGMGGVAVAAVAWTLPLVGGANGAALALIAAWAIPDLVDRRRGQDIEGDLIGAAAFAAVLLLMPIAVEEADPLAGLVGVAVGLAVGLPLDRAARRR